MLNSVYKRFIMNYSTCGIAVILLIIGEIIGKWNLQLLITESDLLYGSVMGNYKHITCFIGILCRLGV